MLPVLAILSHGIAPDLVRAGGDFRLDFHAKASMHTAASWGE